MMDITDYLPNFCHDDNNPTSQYISTIQDQQRTETHYLQLVDHETALSYDTDSREPEILNTHYPVSKNICPNLPSGGAGVLGIEAPTTLLLRHQHDMAANTFRFLDEDMSETQANRTNVDVPAIPTNLLIFMIPGTS
jgi:hypothetical protein